MDDNSYDVNCDLVAEMEEAGVGVEEILQYARGALTPDEIARLRQGLKEIARVTAPEKVEVAELLEDPEFEGESELEETLSFAFAG